MATFLLLATGFPAHLPREVCRCDAPDLDTAHRRLALLSGVRADAIARTAREAMRAGCAHWVQSEASALLRPEMPQKPRHPAAMRARRRTT